MSGAGSGAAAELLSVPKKDNDWPLSSGSPNVSSPPSPSAAVRVLPRGPEVAPDSTPRHAVTPEPLPRKVLRNTAMLLKFGLVIGGFLVLNCYQLAALLLLRPFSVRAYRAAQTALCGSWVNVLMLWLDRLAGNRFWVSGDGDFWSQRATYNAVVMCNHISYGDWPVMFMCAFRAGVAGWLRVVLKRVGAYMPGLGWACAFHEFLFLRRAWDQDAGPMTNRIGSFVANRTPLWIMIFPEGTFTDNTSPQIVRDAHAFADKAHIPRRHHTLLPRVKGFSVLRNAGPDDYISRVVDLTLVFTGQSDPKHCHPFGSDKPLLDRGRLLPDVLSFLNGQSPDVHVHARVYDIADLPRSEADLKKWLFDTFAAKEKLIAAFHETGTFPGGEQQHPLPLLPLVLHQIGWLIAAYAVYAFAGALLPVWLFKALLYAFGTILFAATGVQALMR